MLGGGPAQRWSICRGGLQAGLGDNDSHCSFGRGVEAWEMSHREE